MWDDLDGRGIPPLGVTRHMMIAEDHDPADGHGDQRPSQDDAWEIRQWTFYEQAKRPLDEDDCAETVCKALAAIGFEGLRDDPAATSDHDDPDTVWRHKLAREGKHRRGASLGQLIRDGRAGQRPAR